MKALTYVEVDLDYCALEYGRGRCHAVVEGGFKADWETRFYDNNVGGWTGYNNTLTAGPEFLTITSTGTDPMLYTPSGLSINGSVSRYMLLDVMRMTDGNFDGKLFYTTAGHSWNTNFYKQFVSSIPLNKRVLILADMWVLNAGGFDWKDSTITQFRLDFDNFAGSVFRVYSVGVGHLATAEEATGTHKCFNTPSTCQVPEDYVDEPVTLRFAKPTAYLPKDIEAIPSITDVRLSPGTVSLGEDLGQRATLTVNFEDHRHSDAGEGFDKYWRERPYDPYKTGTFWGKFRARQPYLLGRNIRLIQGKLGQALEDMDTRHYVMESFNGPTPDAQYSISAKDVLKLADGDRAQAPRISNGFLVGDITNVATSATLSPLGIGDLEYPASGYVAIGGKEICAFTRVGNVLTLTRAQYGTEADSHKAQDRVQLCLQYTGQSPADIINDLLVNYAEVDPDFIPLSTWQDEVDTYLRRVYTALIAEPTSVSTLVSELIQQAALAVWWADNEQLIKLQVLRPVLTEANTFTQENVLEGTLNTKEQPDRRISQVWTYFGQINPLKQVDDADNYRSTAATVDLSSELNYGAPSIKKIFSRWIPAFGRPIALRLNDLQLGRFRVPPRMFSFHTLRESGSDVNLGTGYLIESWNLQDAQGLPVQAPIQVTRLNPTDSTFEVEAQESLFATQDPEDLTNRTIIVDVNTYDFNLRSVHDTLYSGTSLDNTITINCLIQPGVLVGSTSPTTPAFNVGSWPAGVTVKVTNQGRIQGRGGDGGNGGYATAGLPGVAGGTALYARYAIQLLQVGEIWGGGGGGGGGGSQSNAIVTYGGRGGGGAGFVPGSGGNAGTTEAGGAGGFGQGTNYEQDGIGISVIGGKGGDGGGPGLPGTAGIQGYAYSAPAGPYGGRSGGAGGAAGKSIDGTAYVTKTGTGDIRGAEI